MPEQITKINNPLEYNIKLQFFTPNDILSLSSGSENVEGEKSEIYGFLSDDGLDIHFEHNFNSSLSLSGTFFDQIQAIMAEGTTVFSGGGANIQGYINTGISFNVPYFWQGTAPITFRLTFKQIATQPQETLLSYMKVLKLLSPKKLDNYKLPSIQSTINPYGFNWLNEVIEGVTKSDLAIQLGWMGPATIDVHYFPLKETNEGTIIFKDCLCKEGTLSIKPPYDKKYSPILGEYSLLLQTSRIIDSSKIDEIFKNTINTTNG